MLRMQHAQSKRTLCCFSGQVDRKMPALQERFVQSVVVSAAAWYDTQGAVKLGDWGVDI